MNHSDAVPSYLDPETLSRVARLDLVARLVVEGFITGLHRSPYHGFSVEFSEHRAYMPGDPLRDLDWKAYAKSDRLYVSSMRRRPTSRRIFCAMCLDRWISVLVHP